MTTALHNPAPASTRRWPRHQVELPIRIATGSNFIQTAVPGLATEISRCGMSFYAGVHLEPGDRMEVEFQTDSRMRVTGVVRNREGYCYGVEFRARMANGLAATTQPGGSTEKQRTGVASDGDASYSAVCAELIAAEDKLATLLQRRLEANMSQHDPEFKRMCQKMLRIRELRRQMEGLSRNA